MLSAALCAVGVLSAAGAVPPVPKDWAPLYPGEVFTSKNGGSAESSPFKWTDGKLYVMHSSGARANMDCPNANATAFAGYSFFHIREMASGRVVACVEESIGHSFFSAAMDNERGRLWVFGSAQNRGGFKAGPCTQTVSEGCYVGAWSSEDLVTWTPTAESLVVPDKTMIFNTGVTFTSLDATKESPFGAHQAIMVMEPRYAIKPVNKSEMYSFALNRGTDGDLTKNWELMFSPLARPIEGCPTIRYDPEERMYYVLGGGHIIIMARSKDLITWEWAKQPMAMPAKDLGHPYLNHVSGNYYTEYWNGSLPNTPVDAGRAFLHNMTSWNWGVSDVDVCCDGEDGPALIMHIVSQQRSPKNWTGTPWTYEGGGVSTAHPTLLAFLKAHF